MPLYRVRSIGSGVAGAPYYSNHHFLLGEGTDAVTGVQAVGAFWSALIPVLNSGYRVEVEGTVAEINVQSGDVVGQVQVDPLVRTGTAAGSDLPPASQARIRWLTGVFASGRQIAGATYVPALTVAALTSDGLIGSTTRTALSAAAAALIGTGNGFSVYSPTRGLTPPVTVADIPRDFAVLRSRRD
uniref:Uncharacterized protein n=1 Tax=uncultured prokaryote TaxID=198431 RepID=A0A0H5Q6A9_9ZZZZ|nr:hypothetical protein [uncultured prokaryote]